jgi:hypothetical protein
VVTAKKRFNPRVHITAGQLRRLGAYVPELVPNGAFVRRAAVGFDDSEKLDRGTATVKVAVLEPFQASA